MAIIFRVQPSDCAPSKGSEDDEHDRVDGFEDGMHVGCDVGGGVEG